MEPLRCAVVPSWLSFLRGDPRCEVTGGTLVWTGRASTGRKPFSDVVCACGFLSNVCWSLACSQFVRRSVDQFFTMVKPCRSGSDPKTVGTRSVWQGCGSGRVVSQVLVHRSSGLEGTANGLCIKRFHPPTAVGNWVVRHVGSRRREETGDGGSKLRCKIPRPPTGTHTHVPCWKCDSTLAT